ncbi:MAG: trehalose-phosphatase, partial [Vicinamibacterales bacterium]
MATTRTPSADTIARLKKAPRLALLLDYDGTLVPIAPTPELAQPQADLLSLLGALAARPGTCVHLVSGRPSAVLGTWFDSLPLVLWAEHGAY